MPTPTTAPVTPFTRDVLGRYVCNGFDEVVGPGKAPFDIIVIGGGTFGAAVAQHTFFRDTAGRHRILVLEGGPLLVPEHVQNLPMIGLFPPRPTSIQALRMAGQFGVNRPLNEVWGLAWHSPSPFPGLAFCIGGRSLYWGGWSPRPLPSELPANRWPAEVLADLTRPVTGDFERAAEQIGVTESNDFIFGALHDELRRRLLTGVQGGAVTDAVPLAQLPVHLTGVPPGQEDASKLEAPLAVQGRAPRSGYFPLNKFSTAPLLIRASRMAYAESRGDDNRKRLVVVPQCHVTRLVTQGPRVVAVETSLGTVPVVPGAVVVVALGTIESTRVALDAFPHLAALGAGQNLMAHLRSNLTIRLPRAGLPATLPKELQASALFLKGRHPHANGGSGHFHLQITAAGLGPDSADSEAELFKKIPDIDHYDRFLLADETHVVITLRGIGEMEPDNSASQVQPDSEPDEFGVPRALVRIQPSARDQALWDAMDRAADEAARVLAAGSSYDVLTPAGWRTLASTAMASSVLPFANRRDGLGTTHHEAGTLQLGRVTDADARLKGTVNAYVAGPALFPTVGSPNPMLTGLALSRRLARHLVPDPMVSSGGFQQLFDGVSLQNWKMAGRGSFVAVAGTLQSVPGDELGLLWCTVPTPPDFVLKLEWMRTQADDNSGVFLRFPDPESKGYQNSAYVGVDFGFEVQIDEQGAPDGLAIHSTGAIYDEPTQQRTPSPARPVGEWNEFEIRVVGQRYAVLLNGAQVTQFTNPRPDRGLPSSAQAPSYFGLQAYPGKQVAFRNIRIQPVLAPPPGLIAERIPAPEAPSPTTPRPTRGTPRPPRARPGGR